MPTRTSEQLNNLKSALFGPFGKIFVSDEEMNKFADKVQDRLDELKYNWKIKVLLVGQEHRSWKELPFESTNPNCTVKDILAKGEDLLAKYPKISKILLSHDDPDGLESYKSGYQITRKGVSYIEFS